MYNLTQVSRNNGEEISRMGGSLLVGEMGQMGIGVDSLVECPVEGEDITKKGQSL
jgi:hypothetical protein